MGAIEIVPFFRCDLTVTLYHMQESVDHVSRATLSFLCNKAKAQHIKSAIADKYLMTIKSRARQSSILKCKSCRLGSL